MTQSPTTNLIGKHYKLTTTTAAEVNKSISNSKTSSKPSLSSSNHSNRNNHHSNHTSHTSSSTPDKERFSKLEIIHDTNHCMFKVQLDREGNTAALCYLPTRCQNMIEFYHTEIPSMYRHQGLGDLLLCRAFQWAERDRKMVIPTCPFVQKYISAKLLENNSCIVNQEKPIVERNT